jgi:hypothetical protein
MFSERAKRTARLRLAEKLQNNHRDRLASVPSNRIVAFADQAIDRASQYDILSEDNVYAYAEAMLHFGLDFDHSPNFRYDRSALNDEELGEDTKAALIRFWLAAYGK